MNGSPKKAPGELASKAERKLITKAAYHALLTKVFEMAFWFFEQRRARLLNRVDNERDRS